MNTGVYDAVVIGGGFKGMMTAYGLTKQGMAVCIIDKSNQLGGFMTPMHWQGVDIDKGPQYLDGVSEHHKLILDEIMGEFEPLDSLDYSYGSFWNDTYTDGFAIPDYRTLTKQDKATILFEALTQTSEPEISQSISELYTQHNQKSYSYINQWCNKFLQDDAENLSTLNRNIVTFFGRKLLLDNDVSLSLKQNPILDNILAATKIGIDHKTHNLYPLGKNLGYFRQAFESRLNSLAVTSITETTVMSVSSTNGMHRLSLSDKQSIQTKAIYCAATIESTEDMLLQNDSISAYIKPVAQIFYLVEIDNDKEMPFYIMNYSDSSISRITNFTAYANKTRNNRSILCAEVPVTLNDAIWNDPDKHYCVLCDEMETMGIDIGAISAHQAFKVPSTYRAVLRGYEDKFQSVSDAITDRHGDDVHLLTPHLLTRASIMADLSERGILG